MCYIDAWFHEIVEVNVSSHRSIRNKEKSNCPTDNQITISGCPLEQCFGINIVLEFCQRILSLALNLLWIGAAG